MSCSDEHSTWLVVVLDTDLEVPGEIDTIEFSVTGPSGNRKDHVFNLAASKAPTLPLVVSLEPASRLFSPVALKAVARKGDEAVVSQSLTTSFVEGETRSISVILVRACIRAVCSQEQYCGEGVCLSSSIPGDQLPLYKGRPAKYKNRVCTPSSCPVGKSCLNGRCVDALCSIGDARQIPCGMCGRQAQLCNDDGQWVDQGSCTDAGECIAGTQEDGGSCERCGRRIRTCGAGCRWTDWQCTNQKACTPGMQDMDGAGCGSTCAQPQVRVRTCTDQCEWGQWGACMSGGTGGECAPSQNQVQTVACGLCGMRNQTRQCTASCTWGAWTDAGSCMNQGECTMLANESRNLPCGKCGMQSQVRSCSSSCRWGAWTNSGGCFGEGACNPRETQTDTVPCGTCGTQPRMRTCGSDCQWGAWVNTGGCGGEAGVCAPDVTTTCHVECESQHFNPAVCPLMVRACSSATFSSCCDNATLFGAAVGSITVGNQYSSSPCTPGSTVVVRSDKTSIEVRSGCAGYFDLQVSGFSTPR